MYWRPYTQNRTHTFALTRFFVTRQPSTALSRSCLLGIQRNTRTRGTNYRARARATQIINTLSLSYALVCPACLSLGSWIGFGLEEWNEHVTLGSWLIKTESKVEVRNVVFCERDIEVEQENRVTIVKLIQSAKQTIFVM